MKSKSLIPAEVIESKIFLIRSKKVMLDSDLAFLYGVETKVLNQAVKRNKKRFPEDFMFQLSSQEMNSLRSQFVTLDINLKSQIVISKGRGRYSKYNLYAFTEQGVAMLSSVLNSKRAIETNIQIIRTFTKLREMIISNTELRRKIEDLERKYDNRFRVVFDTIKRILITTKKEAGSPVKKIGFSDKK
jgi:hypothetical protein